MSDAFIKIQLESPGGLSHRDCLWRVRGALANIDGVYEIMIDTDCRNAVISVCPDRVSSQLLIQALREAGFGTRSPASPGVAPQSAPPPLSGTTPESRPVL